MSVPGLLGLTLLVAALLFLAAMTIGAAGAEEPPPVTVTVTEPDRAEERRLVRQREQWRRTAHKRGRTIRLQRGALRFLRSSRRDAFHPLEAAFHCIHSFEGAWGSNTGNGYYGGLQMDMAFQRAHGPEYLRAFGTANNWPQSVQIAVGIKAYLSRGFSPWPTRRFCGL